MKDPRRFENDPATVSVKDAPCKPPARNPREHTGGRPHEPDFRTRLLSLPPGENRLFVRPYSIRYRSSRMTSEHPPDLPWFHEGLAFECTRCGACCTGEEGFVWVNDEEIEAIAARIGVDVLAFREKYTKRVGRRVSLRERENGDCVFWKKKQGCTVYEDRPRQCRTWPFWRSNIEQPEDWDRTCSACPGSGQGKLYPIEEILRQSRVIDL